MNRSLYVIIFICSITVSSIYAQTNLSPIAAATAQTFGTSLCRGLDAANWNPASLAYKNTIQMPIRSYALPVSIKRFRIHLVTASTTNEADSVRFNIKDIMYKDSLFATINIIEKDSAHTVVIDNIVNYNDAQFYFNRMIENGYNFARIDTFHLRTNKQTLQDSRYRLEEENNFYLEYFNLGFMLSNSSVDANWINTYILNGGDLGELNPSVKNDIISVFPDDGWRLNHLINYKFGLRIKDVALQISPTINGEFVIPRGLFELAFIGNKISEPIDFNSRKTQFQVVLPISMSYGAKVTIPFLDKYFSRSYLGVSAKYLRGYAYFESAFNTLSITPHHDQISIQAHIKTKYSLAGAYLEMDSVKAFNYSFNKRSTEQSKPAGKGYAFDIGLIMDINDKLSTSIAITNLLGKITWGNNTSYEHELKLNSQFPMEEGIPGHLDSLLQEGTLIDTNIAVKSFQTNYPGALILGAEYSFDKIKLASNLKFGFSDELGSSTRPRLSLATELRPLNWLSILCGTSIGGPEKFQWGTGFRMRLLFFQMNFGFSQYGGIFKSAKGVSLSASTSLVL